MLVLKRILFYILSCTGGGIMSLFGGLIILCLLPVKKVHVFHGRPYGVIGHNGGGLNLGCFFLCCEENKDNDYLRGHESGHGLQNMVLGPFFIFVIWLPSIVRYGYRELKYERKGLFPPTAYDDIGFERQATELGQKYIITEMI